MASTDVFERRTVMSDTRFVVVDSGVLPEIILKVLNAKRLRAAGDAKSSAEACRAVGISRSAYYKYKDCVYTYDEKIKNRIMSFYFVLRDEKGILLSVITHLYTLGANILTVNQNIPLDAAASVTCTVKFEGTDVSSASVLKELRTVPGVVEARLISEE
ncbi:MAG: ACT domain-containing protein [Oscillospiraceae bacterium]